MSVRWLFCSVVSSILLFDTSLWWNDDREDHVVDGVLADPEQEYRDGHGPASQVSHSVGLGLVCQFPERGQIHFIYIYD